MINDLWPSDLPSHSVIKTPIAILREQASLLGNKTKNIVEARVVGADRPNPLNRFVEFSYFFAIVGPALGDYHFPLFSISHSIEFYPVIFDIDTGVGKGIAEESQCELSDVPLVANTESEFIEILKTIFASAKTRQVIEAILAQSIT